MEKEQAINVIEQALNITVGKSIFKSEDSAVIFTALTTIKNLLAEPEVDKEEIKQEEVKTNIKSKK